MNEAMSEDADSLVDFDGLARLFPLPNVVLFPHVVQRLHIFEPRYRQMTADALAGDRLIAMALLRPGWEGDYEGQPAIHPTVCVGRIVGEQRLADGRFNLWLRGLRRAAIREDMKSGKRYRRARLELLTDSGQPSEETARDLHSQLSQVIVPWFPPQGTAVEQLHKLLQSALPIGALADILTFAVPLPVEIKQQLLEQLDIGLRVRALIEHLRQVVQPEAATPERQFPPSFSNN
jgi:Lon protease-like protein